MAKALQAMGGAEEIVFAVRELCSATQCYATFGAYSDEAKFVHAPDGSRLCKLNLRTGQVTVLLDETDRAYWRSLWHQPAGVGVASAIAQTRE